MPLVEWLKSRQVDEVFLCGLATGYCVKFAALDAVAPGFTTSVVEDGCRGVNLRPKDTQAALAEQRAAGVRVVNSRSLLT